jgi:hypothetical protein
MRSMLWAGDCADENVHWSRRNAMPVAAIVAWVVGIVATALGVFALRMVGF